MPYSHIGRPQMNTCDVYKLKQQTKAVNNEHDIHVICFTILRYCIVGNFCGVQCFTVFTERFFPREKEPVKF